MQCENCKLQDYSSVDSIWTCDSCPHPSMTYNYVSKSCECGTDADGTVWVNAGSDRCITKKDKDALVTDGWFGTGTEEKVTYFNLRKVDGEDDGE